MHEHRMYKINISIFRNELFKNIIKLTPTRKDIYCRHRHDNITWSVREWAHLMNRIEIIMTFFLFFMLSPLKTFFFVRNARKIMWMDGVMMPLLLFWYGARQTNVMYKVIIKIILYIIIQFFHKPNVDVFCQLNKKILFTYTSLLAKESTNT